ncbi:LytR/AlgR family response regulator transcription factor [Kordiimonas lipolytica]|uniref:LytR/AlgR family response regulator transcription factor n=1 Tax=Kordiimonas lipolytica TaxID=1662421 RepID=A0ABV8UDM2_9PROT|nr:LytTR family DNA-binding domain-containing protein [Kordiimonas lipolytica]
MTQLARRFWLFHLGFWALAGVLLFLSGWTQGGAYVSMVRNLYLTAVGLLLAWPLMLLLAHTRRWEVAKRVFVVGAACYGASLATVLVINPVTFLQLDGVFAEMDFRILTAGSLNYAMVLALWCFFHETLEKQSSGQPTHTEAPQTIMVQKGTTARTLDVAEIDWVEAAGDYAEIHAAGESYLKRTTMTAMEKALPMDQFLRVHRSYIVAKAAVATVEGKSKGAYLLQLRDGARIDTGRSYSEKVKEAFLGA